MPRAKKAPTQPVAPKAPEPAALPTPTPVVVPHSDLPIKFPNLTVEEYSTTSPKGPMTPAVWVKVLGWETEKEYQARKCREEPGSKPEHHLFGDDFHCRDAYGIKVRCNNNANNRPFDEGWCDYLIHTYLHGQWVGPFTIPGETVNGETVRISRTGMVLSGQHQGSACILAYQWLKKAREAGADHPDNPKYPTWRTYGVPDDITQATAPFTETIVVKGVSEDPRVLQSIDYVKPRSAADVFYTSAVFRDSTSVERKELCKVLASAVDLLWLRTEARGYKTHPEIVAFLDRHKRLLDCTMLLFGLNSSKTGRKLAKQKLSPGQCAAICYLMGCSLSSNDDGEMDQYGYDYRNADPAPSEKMLKWDNWDRAQEFWSLLVDSREFLPVRTALARLYSSEPGDEDNVGMGGRGPEKLAMLAKAWEGYKDWNPEHGPAFTNDDLRDGGLLSLDYNALDDQGNPLPEGQVKLLDIADFLGIDCPKATSTKSRAKRKEDEPPDEPLATGEEYERLKEETRLRRQQGG